jgi:predicted  nucleic acid-binding Zn-ribbon protein
MRLDLALLILVQNYELKYQQVKTEIDKIIEKQKQIKANIGMLNSLRAEGSINSKDDLLFSEKSDIEIKIDNNLETQLACCLENMLTLEYQKLELTKELDLLSESKNAAAVKIPGSLMEFYEKVRSRKNIAISEVRNKCCSECRIILTYTLLKKIKSSQQINLCESCGRILYYNEASTNQVLCVND